MIMPTTQNSNIEISAKVLSMRSDLREVINTHIKENKVHPQEVAFVLTELVSYSLSKLAWTPENVSASMKKSEEALKLLKN
jgi:hypothetical protein